MAANPTSEATGDVLEHAPTSASLTLWNSTTSVTVECVLWSVLLLAAAAARLWDLGSQPLSADEAATALQSWQMLRQQGGTADIPLVVYGNVLSFFALGVGDASARLLPALAGIAIVGLPFFARQELGRWGTLMSGVLLTLSPNLLFSARQVSAHSLSAGATLASTIFLVRLASSPSRRWLTAFVVALALLILSGPPAFTGLLVVAVTAAWLYAHGGLPQFEVAELRRAGLLALGIVALGATGLLLNLHGVQEGLVNSFGTWIMVFRGAESQWHLPLQTLLIYESPIALFGSIGVLKAIKSKGATGILVFWAGVALLFALVARDRANTGSPLAVVPLALLAGPVLADVFQGVRTVPQKALAAHLSVSIILLGLFWIATLFFTLPEQILPLSVPIGPVTFPLRGSGDAVLPAQIFFLVATIIGFTLWLCPRYLGRLLGLLSTVVLLLVSFHAAVVLAYASNASAAELPVSTRTSSDIRTMASDVASAVDALATNNRPRAVRVDVSEHAVLSWYLREIQPLRLGALASADDSVVVVEEGGNPPAGRFGLQRYRLQSAWSGQQTSVRGLWRWLLLREAPGPLRYQDVVLYIRLP